MTATSIAEQIRTQVSTITQVVTVDEDSDPNNLIGRPNGYIDAAVLYDSAVQCMDFGSDCGALIEIWPSAGAAKQRADYITTVQSASPIFGSEYHHLQGPVLLRVTGDIKPSENEKYGTAFSAAAS